MTDSPTQRSRRGRSNRRKGARRELEVVALHLNMGIHAKKVSRTGEPSDDVLIYLPRKIMGENHSDQLVCEVKGRKTAKGSWQKIKDWLAGNDVLFLVEDRQEPLVVLPWALWALIIGRRE